MEKEISTVDVWVSTKLKLGLRSREEVAQGRG